MTAPATTSIREALSEIAAQPPGRWHALVAKHFAGDPELIAQALLWLRSEREAPVDAAPPSLGDAGDRYELAHRLDAGATAAVWQAWDRKLGRDVAIKLFHEAQMEALTEARAACDVVSDYVVRVLDVYDGEPSYIVMELVGEHDPRRGFVPGASAAELRPRSLDEAIRWVHDVAHGVEDAHLRDVFHRDLKPHNVLITPVSRRARIGDFGLAVSAAAPAAPEHGARVAGTPEYLAPEQVRGAPARLDPSDPDDRARLVAIDVWGVGALAFDLISGHAPWAGDRELEPWERAAAGERPALPRHTPWGERIPPRLARVIDKAMAVEPAARYATAGELGGELAALLARRPTSLDRSRALRAALWCRRNPQLSITAAAAGALAVLTLAAYTTVVELRARAHTLNDEVHAQERSNAQLAERMTKARDELAATEADLATRGQTLATVRRTLAEEQKLYADLIAARDKALHDADAATQRLVEQLTVAHSDRDAAELGRAMYEGFWTTARHDADQAAKDRDEAHKERDAARGERDQVAAERDTVRGERDAARADRDRATAEVARLTAELAASTSRIERLEHAAAQELGPNPSPSPSPNPSPSPTASPSPSPIPKPTPTPTPTPKPIPTPTPTLTP